MGCRPSAIAGLGTRMPLRWKLGRPGSGARGRADATRTLELKPASFTAAPPPSRRRRLRSSRSRLRRSRRVRSRPGCAPLERSTRPAEFSRTRLRSPEADGVQVGQRVRTYSVNSRTQMHQAKITARDTRARWRPGRSDIATEARNDGARYLMEIVVETGPFLSVPERLDHRGRQRPHRLRHRPGGEYSPRTIHTGLEGEPHPGVGRPRGGRPGRLHRQLFRRRRQQAQVRLDSE